MYEITKGAINAHRRMQLLQEQGYYQEALIVGVSLIEKTFRRTLKQLMISKGFTNATTHILAREFRGMEGVARVWKCFDTNQLTLLEIIHNETWRDIKKISTVRNKLLH